MKSIPLALMLALVASAAFADDASDCQAGAGELLAGSVVSPPTYRHGHLRQGVELSNTLLKLKADKDGKTYQVAVDNVFAAGYDSAGAHVPAPLDTIKVGDRLELCGQPFPGGIHFVHTNCGDNPTPSDPNGWLKVEDANHQLSDNLEASGEYCRLWP